MTIIKTFNAIINGRAVIVETLLAPYTRDGISYRVGRKTLSFNSFWELSPKVQG